jgi:vacuolar iron transporter family protein
VLSYDLCMHHFESKTPLKHVTEKQAEGIISSTEIHGAEMPGYLSAGADAARETAVFTLLLWTLLNPPLFPALAIACAGWIIWKTGRSAWLGWSRLERLHRLLQEEKWEIEHNRHQEKEELKVLYAAKGFEGKLLDEVVDVLMADDERALHVMLREELGLALEAYEHPLKQALGALTGAAGAALLCLLGWYLEPFWGIILAAFATVGVAAFFSAKWEHNRLIDAVVWNLGIAALAFGSVYFLRRV